MKGAIDMVDMSRLPLLLLDNSNMMSVINEGKFSCTNLTFEEAKYMLEVHNKDDILCCFTDNAIESIIFNHLGITCDDFAYKHIRNMRVNQDAIVFKLYETPSESQPIILTEEGIEAKKIQNVYVYCQCFTRTE